MAGGRALAAPAAVNPEKPTVAPLGIRAAASSAVIMGYPLYLLRWSPFRKFIWQPARNSYLIQTPVCMQIMPLSIFKFRNNK
jgi:hypothetical protein